MTLSLTAVSSASALDVSFPATSTLTPGAAPEKAGTTAKQKASTVRTASTSVKKKGNWTATLGSRTLRMGMAGSDVRHLQGLLRRRGERIAVDGEFGRRTRGAVIRTQVRLKMRRTGIVKAAMVRRLGVTIRTPQSAPTTPVPATGDYPLAGANAASAKYLKVFPVAGKHSYIDDFGAPAGRVRMKAPTSWPSGSRYAP